MAYRWGTPLEWLRGKLDSVPNSQLATYLNPILPELEAEDIEDAHQAEMQATGYFDSHFEYPSGLDAHEWLRIYFGDLDPSAQRRLILDVAGALDFDVLQDAFQSEMDQDGYFNSLAAKTEAADLLE